MIQQIIRAEFFILLKCFLAQRRAKNTTQLAKSPYIDRTYMILIILYEKVNKND